MAINRVELKDFLVFKGDFAMDFCSGVNVLIGGNAMGKTTLLKCLYWACEFSSKSVLENNGNLQLDPNPETPYRTNFYLIDYFMVTQSDNGDNKNFTSTIRLFSNAISKEYPVLDVSVPDSLRALQFHGIGSPQSITLAQWCNQKVHGVYIPVAEMLQHSRGFLALERERKIPFDKTQIDILSKAELGETHELTNNAVKLLEKISSVIGGTVVYENDTFYIVSDKRKTPFPLEASGFQKFGLLWKLLRNGLLESGSILFWDEPEASINPELLPVLADILLELQRGGVQVFIATHSYNLARYFDVNKNQKDNVMFYNLSKNDSGGIKCVSALDYTNLPESILDKADEKLFKAVVANAMEVQPDE
jgi:predicted ATPase